MNLPGRDGRVTLTSTHPVRINLDESAWAPMSTFGPSLTGRDTLTYFANLRGGVDWAYVDVLAERLDAAHRGPRADSGCIDGRRQRAATSQKGVTRRFRTAHGDRIRDQSGRTADFTFGGTGEVTILVDADAEVTAHHARFGIAVCITQGTARGSDRKTRRSVEQEK